MAAHAPACSPREKIRVIETAKDYKTRRRYLSMAFEAEIRVPLVQEFTRNGTVRIMTYRAAFPKGFMLEDPRTGLFTVTPAAGCIYSVGEGFPGPVDVLAVRIMTVGAGNTAFSQRVMISEMEFRFHRQMTAETGLRVPFRIYNVHPPSTACVYMLAPGTVTGFASLQPF
jgi:hypothetical protein